MKECPICKSISFDDMEVCFGCLYNFESGPLQSIELVELAEPSLSQIPSSSSSHNQPSEVNVANDANIANDNYSPNALQCAVSSVDQKYERGAHRRRVETQSETPESPSKQLVVIPLEKTAGKDSGAADEKSGYRIEINVVCV